MSRLTDALSNAFRSALSSEAVAAMRHGVVRNVSALASSFTGARPASPSDRPRESTLGDRLSAILRMVASQVRPIMRPGHAGGSSIGEAVINIGRASINTRGHAPGGDRPASDSWFQKIVRQIAQPSATERGGGPPGLLQKLARAISGPGVGSTAVRAGAGVARGAVTSGVVEAGEGLATAGVEAGVAEGAAATGFAATIGTALMSNPITAAATALTAIFVATGIAANRLAESLVDSRREQLKYNAVVANAYARLEQQDVRRAMETARETGGSTAAMVTAVNEMREAFRPLTSALTSVVNIIGYAAAKYVTAALTVGGVLVKLNANAQIALWLLQKINKALQPAAGTGPIDGLISEIGKRGRASIKGSPWEKRPKK